MSLQENNLYFLQVGKEHQKKYAQYFTPSAVAAFMVRWLLSGNKNQDIYDPAFGLGAFFYEASDNVKFDGIEIDPCILRFFEDNKTKSGATISCGDYLLNFGHRHHCIVCNPPYLRFQKIENRKNVFEQFKEKLNINLSGYTNISSAFLIKSISELTNDGRLAYIMPYEFLNAGYGTIVKKILLDGHTCAIIRLDCEKEVFPDATTSICIVLYDKSVSNDCISFYSIDTLQELEHYDSLAPANIKSISALDAAVKWGVHFEKKRAIHTTQSIGLVQLWEYGHFSRGIATGANEFFILSESDMQRLNLSSDDCCFCISKSSQISSPVFQQKNMDELIDNGSRVFLFSPPNQVSQAAKEYIQHGERAGYNSRYILAHRKPWYKSEVRETPYLFLNVFSRDRYKVIKNETRARSLTCYHNFYPNMFSVHLVDVLFLFLYSSIGHEMLTHSQRQYGDHLNKFEPNDLNSALVPAEDYFQKIDGKKVSSLIMNLRQEEDVLSKIDELFSDLIS